MPAKLDASKSAAEAKPTAKVALLAASKSIHRKFKKFTKDRGQKLQFATDEALEEYMTRHLQEAA